MNNTNTCNITYSCYGEETELELKRTTYGCNSNLAIIAEDCSDGAPWGTLTVNTDVKLPDNEACIDVNNIEASLFDAIIERGIGTLTDKTINPGGFVSYPVMAFDLSKIPEV